MLDATRNYDTPLTAERLFGWYAALFPTGRSGMTRICAGDWRDDNSGPMQVVSGPYGLSRTHILISWNKLRQAQRTSQTGFYGSSRV